MIQQQQQETNQLFVSRAVVQGTDLQSVTLTQEWEGEEKNVEKDGDCIKAAECQD